VPAEHTSNVFMNSEEEEKRARRHNPTQFTFCIRFWMEMSITRQACQQIGSEITREGIFGS